MYPEPWPRDYAAVHWTYPPVIWRRCAATVEEMVLEASGSFPKGCSGSTEWQLYLRQLAIQFWAE